MRDLPEVNSAANADNLVIRIYMDNTGGSATEHDLANLSVSYTN